MKKTSRSCFGFTRSLAAMLIAVCALSAVAPSSGAPTDGSVYHDNIVILLDGSGSMRARMRDGVKLDAAKDAIRTVLATTPASTQVGLLVFTARGNRGGWLHSLGPRDDEVLLANLQAVSPGGKTPLGRYLQAAANQLLRQRAAQLGYGTYRLLVVTDGQATDMERMLRVAPQIVARGIVVDVIGVDMTDDHRLAAIAHSYRRANDAASLQSAIQDVLAEIGGAGDDLAETDAFRWLAPFPAGAVQTVIDALAVGNNSPIEP